MNQENRWRGKAWLSFGIADLIFLFFFLTILSTSRGNMLDDPGLGWHLRNVDAMVEAGQWLTEDPFTEPRLGERWFTNQWMGDFVLRASYWWGGLEGIAVITSFILALIYRYLFSILASDGIGWPVAAGWTFMAALASSGAWVSRPNIASLGLVLLVTRICVLFHEGRCSKRDTLWLFPVFVVWTNTHGGFLAGVLIVGAGLASEVALSIFGVTAAQRQASGKRRTHFLFLFLGCLICTLCNPYGINLYQFVLSLLGNEFFMNLNTEWHSPNFHEKSSIRFELLMLLFPTILAFSRFRPSLLSVGLAVLWLHFAFQSVRYIGLWVVIVIPLMARGFVEITWLKSLWKMVPCSKPMRELLSSHSFRTGYLGSLLALAAALTWAHYETDYAFIDQKHIPVKACDFLLSQRDQQLVFHEINWGGYLTWKGWNREHRFFNWIDDRNEVQGETHIKDYFAILNTRGDWSRRIAKHNFELILIAPHRPLAERLTDPNDPESRYWREVYRDDHAILLERDLSEKEEGLN